MRTALILLLLILIGTLNAQLCNGILGEEIYLEDFGSGENYGPELPAGTTGYIYGSIGSGRYVVTNTSAINGTLWHHAQKYSRIKMTKVIVSY